MRVKGFVAFVSITLLLISLYYVSLTYKQDRRYLNLGLDLKGGINIILRISERDLLVNLYPNLSENYQNNIFLASLKEADKKVPSLGYLSLFFQYLKKKLKKSCLSEIFGKLLNEINSDSTDKEVEKVIRKKVDEYIDVASKVLQYRMDRFGIQAKIQRIENSVCILVEFPFVRDVERIKKLLQIPAKLQFFEVFRNKRVTPYIRSLDYILKKNSSLLGYHIKSSHIDENLIGLVDIKDTIIVSKILNSSKARFFLPPDLKHVKFLWSANGLKSRKGNFIGLYAIKTEFDGTSPVEGEVITKANISLGLFNEIILKITMNKKGTFLWKNLTRKALGKNIALVLDDLVYAAPKVNYVISNGHSQISGNFNIQMANDLVNVLNSGRLPTKMQIIISEMIGPSLGNRAIKSFLNASLLALVFVFFCMICFYRTAGFYANLALIFNILFIFGILISIGGVLTLPGLTGIMLTIAKYVDENIFLYESIKEYIKKGINNSSNLRTIIDRQITTLFTGIILFFLVKGPIKVFATTSIIGSFTSIFSSLCIYIWFIENHFTINKYIYFSSLRTEYFIEKIQWNFLSNRIFAYLFSLILLGISFYSLAIRGLNLGVDGGRTYIVRLNQSVNLEKISDKLSSFFSESENGFYSIPEIFYIGRKNKLKITTKYKEGPKVEEEISKKLYTVFRPYLPIDFSFENFKNTKKSFGILYTIKVCIAKYLSKKAFLFVLFSLLGIFSYLFILFERWEFSLAAVISLFHDSIVVLGFFSIFYRFLPFSLEMDQSFIAAMFTIIIYSINDKVIVYNRIIRESMLKNRSFHDIVNQAICRTLSRTIKTSLMRIFVLFIIFLFGVKPIRNFMFAIFLGLVVAPYSSIFISPTLIYELCK
ncbi:MAG TPA: protein translocase subunit SecD [Blattabacteriaceae bacterium]